LFLLAKTQSILDSKLFLWLFFSLRGLTGKSQKYPLESRSTIYPIPFGSVLGFLEGPPFPLDFSWCFFVVFSKVSLPLFFQFSFFQPPPCLFTPRPEPPSWLFKIPQFSFCPLPPLLLARFFFSPHAAPVFFFLRDPSRFFWKFSPRADFPRNCSLFFCQNWLSFNSPLFNVVPVLKMCKIFHPLVLLPPLFSSSSKARRAPSILRGGISSFFPPPLPPNGFLPPSLSVIFHHWASAFLIGLFSLGPVCFPLLSRGPTSHLPPPPAGLFGSGEFFVFPPLFFRPTSRDYPDGLQRERVLHFFFLTLYFLSRSLRDP